jgi:hypothetical protein
MRLMAMRRSSFTIFICGPTDCGRLAHPLDAEHVPAIVSASRLEAPASTWIAEARAAAHEGARSAMPAAPRTRASSAPKHRVHGVFVSRGKHASYFDRGQCLWGCGGDVCRRSRGDSDADHQHRRDRHALEWRDLGALNRWPMRENFNRTSTLRSAPGSRPRPITSFR